MKEIDRIISLRNIYWHRDGRTILNNITWDVERGEHWALLGLNGSGKTSILKIITGYLWPNGGEVSVLGNTFGKTNLPELRKSIGWVSSSLDDQYQSRSGDSVLEAVLSGKFASIGLYEHITKEDVEKAWDILEQFKIKHLAHQRLSSLSQGEKRKTMIARALIPSPRLLILDEPCNGLDIYYKEELLSTINILASTSSGPTIVYVTHHIEEIIPSISHTLFMRTGEVVAQGPKKTTLIEPVLEETFRVPLSLGWENERPWIRIKTFSTT
ncbi:ABC transporter ATP-binding protein [Peribacillus deserti]|uniref:Molybdenum ABC transporter ATP-binding protein n=1 Tax=Peribacillus deserti TaxID=673318 RepID=A0A2N5M5W3_9BACI|nr:ABC transporter ATP-binding protein [Peribacillus deserti]PLT29754.1 molybdenum ABC transporter ATP-binding protein [Peribacillus deserti]